MRTSATWPPRCASSGEPESRRSSAETVASLLSVSSSLLVGLILVAAPWLPVWESNYFLAASPSLRGFVLSAFTRGGVTGLGLVNLAIAFWEARRHLGRSGRRA